MFTDSDDPQAIKRAVAETFRLGIGNNDQTPITRPFTDDSPKFYFTLGTTVYALRFVEMWDGVKGGCLAMFNNAGCSSGELFDVLKCAPGSMNAQERVVYNIEDENHDDFLESIKNVIAPQLQRLFGAERGELKYICFNNPEDGDCGTTVFVYPEDLTNSTQVPTVIVDG